MSHRALEEYLQSCKDQNVPASVDADAYADAISGIEARLWRSAQPARWLDLYQRICREQEQQLARQEHDPRPAFVIVIPVADRPRHLQLCLQSLLDLCRAFDYGGRRNGFYAKVSAVVAEDSREARNIEQHRQLAREFSRQGLQVVHFDQSMQIETLQRLTPELRQSLTPVLGRHEAQHFYHKGPSMMRNITYLWLQQEWRAQRWLNPLFFFIDSDQEFRLPMSNSGQPSNTTALNYFYHLQQIFADPDIQVLTGKVVGDPPVSPAVMAGTFLQDVCAFLQQMRGLDAAAECSFHRQMDVRDGSYHDLADLFGLQVQKESFRYPCRIRQPHDHRRCFEDFARRLGHFFDGEHPTRASYYQHQPMSHSIQPARTIYTGNYVLRPEALRYFIPFAELRLRMAGPVLGRIIKAELAAGFVSANLPMLHKRTVDDLGQSEYRPGVERESEKVDLSDEFERQFYGDVMLFSMERLTALGYPQDEIDEMTVAATLDAVARDMKVRYLQKQEQIMRLLEQLLSLLNDADAWWNQQPGVEAARQQFEDFIRNVHTNYAAESPAWQKLHDPLHDENRKQSMRQALLGYQQQRSNWALALSRT